ncbi:hypothetical protein PG993_009259 [Apiospora rasikravindrae]|uniref:Chitin-binding type-2 domain-containing protein n=1 Tax=Apiospora rasikravindrae TaxID=990691 RepID=A0ABR1SKP5_9PEZI
MQFASIVIAAIATVAAAQGNPSSPPAPVASNICNGGTYQCGKTMNGTSTVQVCTNGSWVTSSICANDWQCQMDESDGATCSP